ncbi:MAG: fructosamine kinase family protein [Phycisphaerales bacterium]|nr:fructosamine kinase family protein [Phycisphaerales bacterium]
MSGKSVESLVASACGIDVEVRRVQSLGGGCIADVRLVEFDSGLKVVAKLSGQADRLEEEADGLSRLSGTGTVRVPEVLGLTDDVLALEYLPSCSTGPEAWRNFGERLADLHLADAGDRFGLERDNHLGETFQRNTFHDDWIEFNRVCRIGPLRDVLAQRGDAEVGEITAIDRVMDALPDLIPARPRPSLLHGDLWSGNAMCTTGGEIAVIDPAVSVGDGLADLAMMQLFGGFPESCFEAYRRRAEAIVGTEGFDSRMAVYRLYHVLNHWVLFGRGYSGQALSIINGLVG